MKNKTFKNKSIWIIGITICVSILIAITFGFQSYFQATLPSWFHNVLDLDSKKTETKNFVDLTSTKVCKGKNNTETHLEGWACDNNKGYVTDNGDGETGTWCNDNDVPLTVKMAEDQEIICSKKGLNTNLSESRFSDKKLEKLKITGNYNFKKDMLPPDTNPNKLPKGVWSFGLTHPVGNRFFIPPGVNTVGFSAYGYKGGGGDHCTGFKIRVNNIIDDSTILINNNFASQENIINKEFFNGDFAQSFTSNHTTRTGAIHINTQNKKFIGKTGVWASIMSETCSNGEFPAGMTIHLSYHFYNNESFNEYKDWYNSMNKHDLWDSSGNPVFDLSVLNNRTEEKDTTNK